MPARPFILAQSTWKTVKDTAYSVAVLPWGATEAHNYHLPYATDVIQCDHIAAESARRAWQRGANVVVLPTIPFGVNTGQLDIKLDINMNPSTQAAVLHDVVDALSGHGIEKIVVLNGHGGNDFRQMIRELDPKFPKLFICTLDWYRVVNPHDFFDEPGDHGGEMETSLMMHLAAERVLPLSEAGDGAERRFRLRGVQEKWVWAQRQWIAATKDTGVGDPAKASAEKGRLFFDAIVAKTADFFVELDAGDINDMYE